MCLKLIQNKKFFKRTYPKERNLNSKKKGIISDEDRHTEDFKILNFVLIVTSVNTQVSLKFKNRRNQHRMKGLA